MAELTRGLASDPDLITELGRAARLIPRKPRHAQNAVSRCVLQAVVHFNAPLPVDRQESAFFLLSSLTCRVSGNSRAVQVSREIHV